jgi:hypothetical protein
MVAVTDKAADVLAASGDPHDYVSVSTYHWPNEKDPKAPWIWKDGHSNLANMERYDHLRLRKMAARVTDGALAWWFTGDNRYAEAAVQQSRVWFIADATRMNPNLNYTQFIPNVNNNKGNKSGIIDLRDFPPTLSAVALLERRGFLGLADRTALRQWFRTYLHWLTTSDLGLMVTGGQCTKLLSESDRQIRLRARCRSRPGRVFGGIPPRYAIERSHVTAIKTPNRGQRIRSQLPRTMILTPEIRVPAPFRRKRPKASCRHGVEGHSHSSVGTPRRQTDRT